MYHLMTFISGLLLLQVAPAFTTLKRAPQFQLVRALRKTNEPCRGKEAGKFVKDLYACDKFFYCGPDEQAIVVDCPQGMIFNDEKEICDFPTNYLCVPRKEEEEDATSTLEPLTTLLVSTQKEEVFTKTTSSREPLNTPSTVIPPLTTTPVIAHELICPSKDNETLIFLPHERECHRYYICYYGAPVAQECISELHWNPKMNRCDFPEKAGCLGSTITPPITDDSTVGIIKCPFRGEQIFPHPEHCNYFIYCINGYATVQQCPFYHYYDIRSRRCLWQTVAKCMIFKN